MWSKVLDGVYRKIGVNHARVKTAARRAAITCAIVPGPERSPASAGSRPSFLRRALRWLIGIAVVAAGLCALALWLLNRGFTDEKPVLRASRFTSTNHVFPVQVAVFSDRVSSYKPNALGHTEYSITLRQIASVKVKAGPVFADVVIDTTGGSPPVTIHGLWKSDAARLATAIAAAQAASPMPVRPVGTPAPPATP